MNYEDYFQICGAYLLFAEEASVKICVDGGYILRDKCG